MRLAVEIYNRDGTRTDASSMITMKTWDVTSPASPVLIIETDQLFYIDGGIWVYVGDIPSPETNSFLFLFENHEDDETENIIVSGMIEPGIVSTGEEFLMIGPGNRILGSATTDRVGARVKTLDNEVRVKRR